jgi:glycine cleavage system H protein
MHPNELWYSPEHVWCRKEPDNSIRLGMTYHYQGQLKNIVYVELPRAGTFIKQGEPFASLESSKIATNLTSPLTGTVLETNPLLSEKPGLINKDPYGQGWMVLVKPGHLEELDGLLTAREYMNLISKQEK